MIKTVLKVNGMSCGMCEAHLNESIRKNFKVKKVKSSHKKAECEIISENKLDEELVKKVVLSLGYEFVLLTYAPYENKGLFGFLKK